MSTYNTDNMIETKGLALEIPRKGSGVVPATVSGAKPFFFGAPHA